MGAFYFAWWEKVIESRVGKNGKGRIGRGHGRRERWNDDGSIGGGGGWGTGKP